MSSPVTRLADTIDGLVAASVRLEEALSRGAPELTVHRLRRALADEAVAAKHVADGTRTLVASAEAQARAAFPAALKPHCLQAANENHADLPDQPGPSIA